jgi:hypothetical protein
VGAPAVSFMPSPLNDDEIVTYDVMLSQGS